MIVYKPFLLWVEHKTKNLHMNLNTTTSKKEKATTIMRTRLLIPLSSFCCVWLMVFTFSRCCLMANGEFYSSVESLKILANIEATVTQNFRQHLKLQKQDIESVRSYLDNIKRVEPTASVNSTKESKRNFLLFSELLYIDTHIQMIVYKPFLLWVEHKTQNLHMNLNTTTSKNEKATTIMRTRLLIPLSSFCCVWLMVFTFSRCCLMANGEFYSSVESLKILANIEATVTQNFRQHLKLQKQDIESVRRFIKDVKFKHELAKVDVNDYIGNPINSFTLIKRLVNDWNDLFKVVKFSDIKIDMEELSNQLAKKFLQLPDDNELKGAIRGLGRLQIVYNISVDEMVKGEKYGKTPDWRDCFEIGTAFLDDSSLYLAIDWLKQSHLKLQNSEETDDIKSIFTTHINEYLAKACQGIGEFKIAMEHLDAILKNDPQSSVKLTKNLLLNNQTDISSAEDLTIKYPHGYTRLCRGESLTNKQQLSCKLNSKLHPFFILSPVQVEPLLLNPQITLYHNVINDDQIAKLLSLTINKFSRATVKVGKNNVITTEFRVCQQAKVDPETSNIAKMMYRTVGAITGFDLRNAEILNVANYGIGGQFDLHYDYFGLKNDYQHGYVGDRISTNMFYLSDVEEGGFTVFPELDVYAKPVKGSMLMWYNLDEFLNADSRTLHAGCPVLSGSKKIANIWTYSGYQELRRPCALKNNKIK